MKIGRASDGGRNVDRGGGLQPMAKSSALRRSAEMSTERRIAAAGCKSGARRAAGGMSADAADFSRWANQPRSGCWRKCRLRGGIAPTGGNRSFDGWRKCRSGRRIAADAKIWRELGRGVSTKTADVNTGGGGSHFGGWGLKRRTVSDGVANMSIATADCVRCGNLSRIGMGKCRLKWQISTPGGNSNTTDGGN